MTQEVLKQMYQLLLTEPHAPTVCAQLERIAREALAEHAMQEVQRLGQEIEQEPVAWGVDWGKTGDIACVSIIKRLPNDVIELVAVEYAPYSYTTPPQRKPLTDEAIAQIAAQGHQRWLEFARAIEAAHDIKGEA